MARLSRCGLVLALVGLIAAPGAFAQSAWWRLGAGARPTDLQAGPGQIVVTAANVGDVPADGEAVPMQIADTLPAGVKAQSIEASIGGAGGASTGEVVCTLETLTCTFAHDLPPYAQIEVRIDVNVEGASSGEIDEAKVSGAGAPSATVRRPIAVDEQPPPVQSYALSAEEEGGAPDTQAGSHPFQANLALALSQTSEGSPVTPAKEVRFDLPSGLLVNFAEGERCPEAQFNAVPEPACSSVAGMAIVTLHEAGPTGVHTVAAPVYSLQANEGEPARLGFMLPGSIPVYVKPAIRTGADNGVTLSVSELERVGDLDSLDLTIWGTRTVGGAHSFWDMPTSCAGPLQSSAEIDASGDPTPAEQPLPALGGCNELPFEPSFGFAVETPQADTSAAMKLEVHAPLQARGSLSEAGIAAAAIALPDGIVLNPGAEQGLQECTAAQFAPESASAPTCPEASQLATVKIATPLAANPLEGAVYAAAHSADPFDTPLALYLVAADPVSGVAVKLAGTLSEDPLTDQLVVAFGDLPQLPLRELELQFQTKERTLLQTPRTCGSYTATATFAPRSGGPETQAFSTFDITSGSADEGCGDEESTTLESEEDEEAERRLQEEELADAGRAEERLPAGLLEREAGTEGFRASSAQQGPTARIASTDISVSPTGVAAVKVSCPPGQVSCAGKITLRTVPAHTARATRRKAKAPVLTLATGPFKAAAGKTATVKLRLSAKARALLARAHVLRASASVVARTPVGATSTTQADVTLREAKPKHATR
jgi:hypothetical protein